VLEFRGCVRGSRETNRRLLRTAAATRIQPRRSDSSEINIFRAASYPRQKHRASRSTDSAMPCLRGRHSQYRLSIGTPLFPSIAFIYIYIDIHSSFFSSLSFFLSFSLSLSTLPAAVTHRDFSSVGGNRCHLSNARIANNLSSGNVSRGIDTPYSIAACEDLSRGISRNTKSDPSLLRIERLEAIAEANLARCVQAHVARVVFPS